MEVRQYIMRSLNLLILYGKGGKPSTLETVNHCPLPDMKGDGQGVVITKGFSLSTTYKILSSILLSCLIPYTDDISEDHLC